MYEPVQKWLQHFLNARFKQSDIRVYDTSLTKLASLIDNHGLQAGLPADWPTWDIQIDVVGFVRTPTATHLAFVECKNTALALDHVAQLLGYARVAKPQYAFLLSPQGAKRPLAQLLKTHQRLDVLEFTCNEHQLAQSLAIARWDANAESIAFDTLITTDTQKVELSRFLKS
jgi:hypothetical protein